MSRYRYELLLAKLTPPINLNVLDFRLCSEIVAAALASNGFGSFFHTHASGEQPLRFAALFLSAKRITELVNL